MRSRWSCNACYSHAFVAASKIAPRQCGFQNAKLQKGLFQVQIDEDTVAIDMDRSPVRMQSKTAVSFSEVLKAAESSSQAFRLGARPSGMLQIDALIPFPWISGGQLVSPARHSRIFKVSVKVTHPRAASGAFSFSCNSRATYQHQCSDCSWAQHSPTRPSFSDSPCSQCPAPNMCT